MVLPVLRVPTRTRGRRARLLPGLLALSLVPAGVLLPAGAAGAAPLAPTDGTGSDRGPEASDLGTARDPGAPPASAFATPLGEPQAKARSKDAATCPLSFYPVDPADVSGLIGVTPYADVAPRLCTAARSDRVTLEVAGTSLQGREIPLVTITSPESAEERAADEELEALLTEDPTAAKALLDAGGYDGYKPSLMLNMSIHGNEYEGVDNGLNIVEHLATAPEDAPVVENTDGLSEEEVAALPTVGELLDSYRVVVLSVANPDGRVLGQRQNANSIDLNRDHITQSQPEQRVMRDALLDARPLLFQDHHGYVNGSGTSSFYSGYGLLEPTSPPHGEAYEYDLYIDQALPLALQAEEDILRRQAAGDIPLMTMPEKGITIPFRDIEEGWDDWPPIFTPMYAMYLGAVGATVEVPFSPRGIADEEARRAASQSSIEYGRGALDTMLVYGVQNRDSLLSDQLDVFRRGEAGAPSPMTEATMPDGYVEGWGPEDRYPTTYPRAYVIPTGDGQASETAAADLVQFLLDNAVEVSALTAPATLDGTTYPAGSYVVDMHQALRGMAHTILHEGSDVSDRVDTMYDISGWSLALLWGATVTETLDASVVSALEPVTAPAPVGGALPAGDALGYSFRLTSPGEITLLTGLWEAEVPLQRTADGTVLVPASARDALATLAAAAEVAVQRLTTLPTGRTELPPVSVATAIGTGTLGTSTLALLRDELGLDVTPLSRDEVADLATDLSTYDVLLTAEGQLAWEGGRDSENLGEAGQARLTEYLADGGGLVSYGRASALGLVGASGLVAGLEVVGSRRDANGVMPLVPTPDAPALGDRPGPAASFGYPIAFFPETGEATAEQTLAEDPLVSGHWVASDADAEPGDGQEAAAGQALTVSAELTDGGACSPSARSRCSGGTRGACSTRSSTGSCGPPTSPRPRPTWGRRSSRGSPSARRRPPRRRAPSRAPARPPWSRPGLPGRRGGRRARQGHRLPRRLRRGGGVHRRDLRAASRRDPRGRWRASSPGRSPRAGAPSPRRRPTPSGTTTAPPTRTRSTSSPLSGSSAAWRTGPTARGSW